MNNTTTREQQARAILSQPRNYYAAKDGINHAEELLALWDELASEFPDIVEATSYFSGKVRPDCMAVRYVEEVEIDGDIYMWLDLKTCTEKRQCRYQLVEGCWVYDGGDKEPDMSLALSSAWEKADSVINRVRETQQTNFISA